MAKYLFHHIGYLRKTIAEASKIVVFMDYDGTLVGFKPRPELALPSKNVINLLNKMKDSETIIPIIITGRHIREIKHMIGIEGIGFAGAHGIQVEMPKGKPFEWIGSRKARPDLNRIRKTLQKELSEETGVIIEDKDTSIALHYRMVNAERAKKIQKIFRSTVKRYNKNKKLEIMRGSDVLEARPKGWDKGKAVGLVLKKLDKRIIRRGKPFIIYAGDDYTDEDAFRYIRRLKNNGFCVWVRNGIMRKTKAEFWVKNHSELLSFLDIIFKTKNKRLTTLTHK